ncbi:MAG: homoserine dehydrogenase [Ekhidna sp.]
MNKIRKIGLFGFGVVGKGVFEILQKHPLPSVKIEKVCVKRLDLERINHDLYFTTDPDELLNDPSIDIIIEVISDPISAKDIVHKALSNGKAVISANKKMIAESLHEVNEWHQLYDTPFLYEAAVGGGIPIVYNIDSHFRDQSVTRLRGILNGSSNYILTKMQEKNWSFDQALANAQKAGFAELNPALDVDGTDAAYKLSILAFHSFGEIVSMKMCEIESVRTITDKDVRNASKKNRKIKPVATVEKIDGEFLCSVKPEVIKVTDELYNVDDENNAISVHTEISGSHLSVGKGAGSLPTGSAIVGDLKRVLKGYRYQIQEASVLA